MPLDRLPQPNVEQFAKIVVTVGLMEIGSRISPFLQLEHGAPAFCDWWKSSIVDNFAFNKWSPSKSGRYRLAEKEYFGFCDRWLLITRGFHSLNWVHSASVYLKSSIASLFARSCARMCVCTCVRVSSCICARNIDADIAQRRLNGRACEVLRSYLCSRHTSPLLMHCPQIESGNR